MPPRSLMPSPEITTSPTHAELRALRSLIIPFQALPKRMRETRLRGRNWAPRKPSLFSTQTFGSSFYCFLPSKVTVKLGVA